MVGLGVRSQEPVVRSRSSGVRRQESGDRRQFHLFSPHPTPHTPHPAARKNFFGKS
ncbi:hypothetical protein [Microcystis sp. M169S2]|uniref:hypothetical protein n=1 Tax=Microcystis sp. M169S2 TaxID=2771157 RepID=UPI00258F0944|nr:hypothetical protein [Microcystis sp. M169S2]